MFALRCGGVSVRERAQENPPSVTESALARVKCDSPVSYNSFRIATPRRNSFNFYFSSWDSFVPFISERAKSRRFGIFDAPYTATDSMFLVNYRSRRWAGRLPRVILERYFAPVFPRRQLQFAAANPLPAIARWGVVQLVGHLTVNEDGEGSNPSAPANFPL